MRFRLIKRETGAPAACLPRRPRSQNTPRPAPPTSTTPMAGITEGAEPGRPAKMTRQKSLIRPMADETLSFFQSKI